MRLEGKTAIITGAAQGLGRAIALDFAAEGAEMLLADIQGEKVAQVAALIGENGGRAEVVEVDVTDAAQVEAMIQSAIALFGDVDILVNDAGGSGTVGIQHIEDVTEEMWEITGHPYSIHQQMFPTWDEQLAAEEKITLVVQVNGKVRDKLEVPADIEEAAAQELALASPKVQSFMNGKTIFKSVYVPGRLVNLVVQ